MSLINGRSYDQNQSDNKNRYFSKHPRQAVGVVILAILLVGVALTRVVGQQTNKSVNPDTVTTISSRLSNTTAQDAVNAQLDLPPNEAATAIPVELIGTDQPSLPSDMQYEIHEMLPTMLSRVTVPTFTRTYAQIDSATVNCPTKYDCRFSIYLDSPERYFAIHLYNIADGSQAYTITQEPIPGVDL